VFLIVSSLLSGFAFTKQVDDAGIGEGRDKSNNDNKSVLKAAINLKKNVLGFLFFIKIEYF